MKYLSACLALVVTSSYASADLQECLANTDLNPENRFSHEVLTLENGSPYKVVNDAATGLQWGFCFVGQTLSNDQQSCEGVAEVVMDLVPERQYTPNVREKTLEVVARENRSMGETNNLWHLPNVKDLLSIYNERCVPAYYPVFSHKIGLTTEQINELKDTKIDYSLPAAERKEDTAKNIRGWAYHSMNVSTDSNSPGRYLFFYTVSFSGHGTPASANQQKYSVMRLVRKKP
ncbi:DUF1566 domain-containing protein [Vibrio sonorensis]|uniref:DUF1566 domain-containing protein n=1 Tax=Vibrio sonorensis TaxID=1004316 RepID=UPI0008D8F656|nr:DUF1566 domain-containing protein [Vibrio sonorensis]